MILFNSNDLKFKDLAFLDGLRGFAAFYVLVGHSRYLLWEGLSCGYALHPELYSLIDRFFMYFFSLFIYGREMVLLFFIISGFVIHCRNSSEIVITGKVRFSFITYLKRRGRRIYPPFIFSIILTFISDSYLASHNIDILFANNTCNNYANNIFFDHSLGTLIGNLSFVMNVYVNVWGSNGPLWSLMYEWWFYMLYPIFLYLSILQKHSSFILLSIIFILLLIFPNFFAIKLVNSVLSLMLYWWLGTTLADIYTGRIKLNIILVNWLMILLPLGFIPTLNPLIKELMWALFFIGFISFVLVQKDSSYVKRIILKFKVIGNFSYTLYICHMPLVVLMSGLIQQKKEGLPQNLYWVLIAVPIILVVCWLFYLIAEKPFLNTSRNYK